MKEKKIQKQLNYWLDFLFAMTEKEIKARYKHATLGFLWVLLNPLLQMLVIGFVFQFFVPVETENYFLFLFAGLLPWNFFSMSVTKTAPTFVYERSLIQKAKFPRESIVLSIVFSNFFHLLTSFALFLPVVLLFGLGNIFNWFILVPALLWLLLLTSGMSLLFSSLNVKYRDVNFVVQAIMPLWFYATPVVYSLSLIPQSIKQLFYLNPMTGLILLFRYGSIGYIDSIITGGELTMVLLAGFIVSILIFLLGIRVFKKESPTFDDWM